jgi:hypothetical protein
VRILLDGQQRVTTLYLLMRGELPPYYKPSAITNDTRGLYVNLETLELAYYIKSRMENNPLWQDVTAVLQKNVRAKDVVRALEARGEAVDRRCDDLIDDNTRAIESILDREFPEQTIPIKASVREARNLLHRDIGKTFVAAKVAVGLPEVAGHEICQVDVDAATTPLVITSSDKHGQKVEKFYVRSGNTSQELPLSEMHSYVKERFK